MIGKRELFGKWDSLYKRAFCSGIVGRYARVSPMVQVYSWASFTTGRTAMLHILGILIWHQFVRHRNQESGTLTGIKAQDRRRTSNSETGERRMPNSETGKRE